MSRNAGKAEIASKIAEALGIFRSQTPYKLVSEILNHLKTCVYKHNKVSVSRFGTFYKLEKDERKGRNPKTGEKLWIPPRTLVRFKASPILKRLFEN
ncbi:MAG: HU family DNA-binding protein [Deltaproteobacteria bacterium]|nr:HU family DNA-binding protein [Deltaproteobacteria bacterium]MCX7952747.1 HU family DNA-binding protein [Deltaproteobacteria bacterium]